MNNNLLHISGLELANLVVSSGILNLSWTAISEHKKVRNENEEISWRDRQQGNCRIIAFVSSPSCSKRCLQEKELVSSSSLPPFQFLCGNKFSSFSIHKPTVTLFDSIYRELLSLKSQLEDSSVPLIITGQSLGGSVAALFTLWLLENLGRVGTRRPLCITFGVPLMGDKGLQQIISQNPTWGSCFLHVAAIQDTVPRLFISPQSPDTMQIDSQIVDYEPFATYLLCSKSGYTCVEDHEVVLELLMAIGTEETTQNQEFNREMGIFDYEKIVQHLSSIVKFKGISQLREPIANPLRARVALQVEALGVTRTQQLVGKLEEYWERTSILSKKEYFDPSKKLNDVKVNMVQLEWYKKDSKSNDIGYYDRYKNKLGFTKVNEDVVKYKKLLNIYWEKMVEEAEKRPQTEEATFRTRWLYAGTNYRRMVEPLDIADFYREEKTNYLTNGRSPHYIKLEQWLGKPGNVLVDSKRKNVGGSLTEDSCFWAHVEEALIRCKMVKNGCSEHFVRGKLVEFEKYVMEQIKNYAVSPEIFLERSSFMSWWQEYKDIVGNSYSSELTGFLRNSKYKTYAEGTWVFDRNVIGCR